MEETVEDMMDVGEVEVREWGEAKVNRIMNNLTCLLIPQGPHGLIIIAANLVIFKKFVISYMEDQGSINSLRRLHPVLTLLHSLLKAR